MTDRPTIAELCAPLSAVPTPGERQKTSSGINARLTVRRRGGAVKAWGNGEVILRGAKTQAFRLHREGKTIPEIAEVINSHPVHVYRLLSEAREKGEIE